MDFPQGTRLGPYEVISRVGAGGMGEVFKARDTRLERSVAIKILPQEFAANAHLRLRFEREAKSISQLNHPHICTLHDIGRENETTYLVMEFVEGETIADRLRRGSLSISDAMRFGAEIADALDSAHRIGVVHRDVKPGNIMISKSGVKLLDFGLAKEIESSGSADDATEHKPLTEEGAIVGTVPYMAPEQLTGERSDARTDIFALGVVLYEMIAGKRAFEGKSRSSLIGAILSGAPEPLHHCQPLTPPALRRLVDKCLEKDPDQRWQSAKDVADELRWIASLTAEPVMRRSSGVPWTVAGATIVVAAIAIVGAWSVSARKADVVRLELTPPAGWIFGESFNTPIAVSPDGQSIVFSAAAAIGGKQSLWLRNLSDGEAFELGGTEGGRSPFWSHDGRSIGFIVGGLLKRVSHFRARRWRR